MGEVIVKKLNLDIQKGYIYFLDEDGRPSRVKQISDPGKKIKVENISSFKVTRKPGQVYFINKHGNIARVNLLKDIKLENKNIFSKTGKSSADKKSIKSKKNIKKKG